MSDKNRVKPRVSNTNDSIVHFSLQDLLPSGRTLAFNPTLGTLSLLAIKEDYPCLLIEQQFTASELCVLLPLLDAYPYYCPYEVTFASFNYGNVNEERVVKCRKMLQEAALAGIWDEEMKPVRNVLSRTRLKLREFWIDDEFWIDVVSIIETGYMLKKRKPKKQL